MATVLTGLHGRAGAAAGSVRRRVPALDHLIRAYTRYVADTGDRLAAGVTYFGFLSFFPLVVLAVSVPLGKQNLDWNRNEKPAAGIKSPCPRPLPCVCQQMHGAHRGRSTP